VVNVRGLPFGSFTLIVMPMTASCKEKEDFNAILSSASRSPLGLEGVMIRASSRARSKYLSSGFYTRERELRKNSRKADAPFSKQSASLI
jgi:hypothetical protein